MIKFLFVLLVIMVGCAQTWAADEFDEISCGADIPKAMVGKKSPTERVMVLESRHPNLGLKDLGGMEISDRLFVVSWRICGSEYAVLSNTKQNLVRDVLPVPVHSMVSPLSFFEGCRTANKELPDAVIAILDNSQGQKAKSYDDIVILPAKAAWKIDERQERFVSMPTKGLSCALSGSSPEIGRSDLGR